MNKKFFLIFMVITVCYWSNAQNISDFEILINQTDQYITVSRYIGTDVNIIIPEQINGLPVTTISGDMFNSMMNWGDEILTIFIPKTVNLIEVSRFSTMFPYLRNNILEINVDSENEEYYSIDGVLFNKNNTLLFYPRGKTDINYIVPNTTLEISSGSFYHVKHLLNVILPFGIKEIPRYAFSHSNIYSVYLPESIETIDALAFYGSKIHTINFPENLKFIGPSAFYNCDNLTREKIIEIGSRFGRDSFLWWERAETDAMRNYWYKINIWPLEEYFICFPEFGRTPEAAFDR